MLDPSGPVLMIQMMNDPPDYAGRIRRYRMTALGWQSTILDCFLFKTGEMRYLEKPGSRKAVKPNTGWVQQHIQQQHIDAGVHGVHFMAPIEIEDGSHSPTYAPSSPGYEKPGSSAQNPFWVEDDEEKEKEDELIAHDEEAAIAEDEARGNIEEEEAEWAASVPTPAYNENNPADISQAMYGIGDDDEDF